MADSICLAIDAMGGDFGPRVTVPAAVDFLRRHADVRVILFGDESVIRKQLSSLKLAAAAKPVLDRIDVHHCEQVVTADDKPSIALRRKRESSMWVAVNGVADGGTHACVSAGNTGALMAMGLSALGLFKGIDRPAICTAVPSLGKRSYLLDAGANLECSPEQLHQFATMANCLVQAVEQKDRPTIGLLNVGSEELKGGRELQETAKLLEADRALNYFGFVEGDDIYLGTTDVVVCDGFSGNIAIKAGEGVAKMIALRLQKAFSRSLGAKIAGVISRGVLRAFQRRIDPAGYNGASFLGLRGVVVKSHGSANQKSFACALEVALGEARARLPSLIEKSLQQR
ncbi:phosphate acyltransferase PlsX [Porticoccaceae bacterium LTM1]|nr:phosphate acyltransferase PlsX [Porticoccaceae bacterium LTM1]